MKILIITPFLPYPITSGGAQAQYNMIDCLRKSHDVALVFPLNLFDSGQNVNKLKSLWPQVEFYPYPYYKQLFYPPIFFNKLGKAINRVFNLSRKGRSIKDALANYMTPLSNDYIGFVNKIIYDFSPDLIQVEFFLYIGFGKNLPRNIKKVFVHHEIRFVVNDRMTDSYELSKRQIKLKQKRKRQEIDALNYYDAIIVLTETDKNKLIEAGVKRQIFVSPAAVNTNMLPFSMWNKKLIYIGSHSFYPNKEGMDWFVYGIAPLINWDKYKGVSLNLIGTGWNKVYNDSPSNLKINYLGYVENLLDVASGGIMIVPLKTGSGMRMKLLDASAMSLPILSTKVGMEGLALKDGESCLLADDEQSFAEKLKKLMEDEDLQRRIGQKANDIFVENYSLKALYKIREDIYILIQKASE